MKIQNILMAIFLSLFMISCEKEYEIIEEETISPEVEELILASIKGVVLEEDTDPSNQVNVKILANGTTLAQSTTDAKGEYSFTDESMSKEGVLLEYSKIGFTSTYQHFMPSEGQVIYTKANIFPSENVLNFGNSDNVNFTNEELSIIFENNILDSSNAPFTLNINYQKDKNSSLTDFGLVTDENGNEAFLDITSILSIEILDVDSQKVSLKEGELITIIVNNNLPSNAMVWNLNKEKLRWEENKTLESGANSFSILNIETGIVAFGESKSLSKIQGMLVSETQEPLSNVDLKLVDTESGNIYSSISSSNGEFRIETIAGKAMHLIVDKSGYDLLEMDISTKTSTDLGTVVLSNKNASELKILTVLENTSIAINQPECSANYIFPEIEIEGMDNSEVQLQWESSAGKIEMSGIFELHSDDSPVSVKLLVKDGLGNSAIEEFVIEITDNIAPSPICLENLKLSMPEGETVTLFALDIDAGSIDCGSEDVNLLIARMDSCPEDMSCPTDRFKESIEFSSEDAHNTQATTVILRVFDSSGNYSDCWGEVTIELADNLEQALICGEDKVVDCLSGSLEVSGPEFLINPSELHGYNFEDKYTVEHGNLLIDRKWTGIDWETNLSYECSQNILVQNYPITPVAICQAEVIVKLNPQTFEAEVRPEMFLDGFICESEFMFSQIRRIQGCVENDCSSEKFDQSLVFSEIDLTLTPIVVEIKITNLLGNSSSCWAEVILEK